MTCETCEHWYKGICKRYPPKSIPVKIAKSLYGGYIVEHEKEVVNTDKDDFCGEWKITKRELQRRMMNDEETF